VKGWVTAAVVAAAATAGAAAYLWSKREPPAAEPAGPFASAPAPQLAATLPAFELADRDGVPRTLQHWAGRALIVNFWATWCAPCRREIPLLQSIQQAHGAEGFQVVGIAVDFRDKVLAYADEMQIDYPLLIGEQEALDAAGAFGVEAVGFPFTVFADKAGRIVAAHLGELHAEQAEVILAAVRRVDAGELSPLEARAEIDRALAAGREAAAP